MYVLPKVLRSKLSAASLGFTTLLLAGCAATNLTENETDASWARKVASHTAVNLNGATFKDAEKNYDELLDSGTAPNELANVALAGSFIAAPKGPGSIPVLDGLLVLDMLLGGASTPDHAVFHYSTLAWFPASQASSAQDAQLKFHEMRLSKLVALLDKHEVEYEIVADKRDNKVLWKSPKHTTVISISKLDERCNTETSCRIHLYTAPPLKEVGMAPQELTGRPFEAYVFDGHKDKWENSWLWMAYKQTAKNEEAGKSVWHSRDHSELTWLSQVNPDWAVEYTPMFKPETLRQVLGGNLPGENPYPFLVHKGEIKQFVKGAK